MADVKIVDAAGDEVETGCLGEVCIRAPYTMQCYYNDPEATAAKFLGEWMKTGDVGLKDRDGYVFRKDRTADMIITGGMNVYSTQVEAVLHECPGIVRAAVIGVPDTNWGEAVHAVVVPESPWRR